MADIFPFRLTKTSLGTSKRVVMAQLLGVGAEGSDDSAEPAPDAEVWTPLGLASRPKLQDGSANKCTALAVRFGDEAHILHVRDKNLVAFAAADLAEGDVVLYSPGQPGSTLKIAANGDMAAKVADGQTFTVTCNGAQIQIDANGAVTIAAASGQSVTASANNGTAVIDANGAVAITAAGGQSVSINGGSNGVGRVGDAVRVTIPSGTFGTAFVGTGSLTLNPTDVHVDGTITAGSTTVIAGG